IETVDPYAIRSGYALGVVLGYEMRSKDLEYALLRKLAAEWRRIIHCFRGDFYPLTPYSLDEESWIAWQFHLPARDEGVVQAFRRQGSDAPARTFGLGGLDPEANYRITDLDAETSATLSGRELIEHGLTVKISSRPGAAVVHYAALGR
ncbi:MAG: GH36 C-terminal domain-containing protein, partial [Planctomycetes bacterium]|nr:GH36 C-terminal domain-containing protein [Planctomycetota bacterium]